MAHKRDAQALVTQAVFLVNSQHEMLIIQLPDGRWQLPGGKLHHQETWSDGIRREIAEETNINDVNIVRVLFVDNWHTASNDYYRTYFLCTTMAQDITLSSDHCRYKWINKNTDLSFFTFTHETVKEHISTFFSSL